MLTRSPNKPHCVAAARTCLIEFDCSKWHQQLMHNGNAANGNKLRTYRQYKNVLKTEHYVTCNLSRGHRRTFAKFRSCNLPLVIERLCKFCDTKAIEDETHFLVDCEFYSDLRYQIFKSAQSIDNTFIYYDSLKKNRLLNEFL